MLLIVGMALVTAAAADSSNPAADAAMERYADGDAAAFGALYDALAPRLQAFLSRQLRDPALAADVLQETMLRLHCARGRFVRGSRVSPWAFTIARRLMVDRLRRSKVEQLALRTEESATPAEPAPAPDELLGSQQQGQTLKREISKLPQTQRAAFELVHYGELSYAEAAESLGVSVASVKLRVFRANKTIRAAVGAVELGEP